MIARPVTEIRPPSGGLGRPLVDLWTYRPLIRFFVWRDLKVRYRQTVVGVGWAVFQPLSLMAIFSVFLSGIINIPGDQIPYWLFVFAGLIPWTLFAQSMAQAANSLVNHPDLIRKAAFPKLVLPTAAIGPYLVDFIIGSFFALAATGIVLGRLSLSMILLPFVGLLAALTSLAVGIGLSALNVKYRDVRYAAPFLIQTLLFATPVVYPISLAPEGIQNFIYLNPMTGVVELYRWSLFGGSFPGWTGVITSLAVGIVLLALSTWYFMRSEAYFADVI